MSCLGGNLEDRFSRDEAHLIISPKLMPKGFLGNMTPPVFKFICCLLVALISNASIICLHRAFIDELNVIGLISLQRKHAFNLYVKFLLLLLLLLLLFFFYLL